VQAPRKLKMIQNLKLAQKGRTAIRRGESPPGNGLQRRKKRNWGGTRRKSVVGNHGGGFVGAMGGSER